MYRAVRLGHSQHDPSTTAEQSGVCICYRRRTVWPAKKRKLNLADVSNPVVRFRVRSDKWLLSVRIHQEDIYTTDAFPLCRPTRRVVEKRQKQRKWWRKSDYCAIVSILKYLMSSRVSATTQDVQAIIVEWTSLNLLKHRNVACDSTNSELGNFRLRIWCIIVSTSRSSVNVERRTQNAERRT